MTVVRSRRAGISAEAARQRPLYAKVLGLQYLRPSSLLCFVLFEGAVAVSALLALAELADWWVVAVLPASVAAMVKLNDVVAGAALKAASDRIPMVRGQASVPQLAHTAAPGVRPPDGAPGMGQRWGQGGGRSGAGPGLGQSDGRSGAALPGTSSAGDHAPDAAADEWLGSPEQRARQSATRRYE
jgi:hypothetical protein